MKLYKAKLKSRKQIMAEIPREQQGWWADVCAGKTLTLRDATEADIARCTISSGQTRDPADYLCEACERGSLVRRIAIKDLTEIPDRRATPPSPSTAEVDELLGRYWEIAYSEGKTGEPRGSEAQEVLSSLRAALASRPAVEAGELPPLPDAWGTMYGDTLKELDGYTADQMRGYGLDCMYAALATKPANKE